MSSFHGDTFNFDGCQKSCVAVGVDLRLRVVFHDRVFVASQIGRFSEPWHLSKSIEKHATVRICGRPLRVYCLMIPRPTKLESPPDPSHRFFSRCLSGRPAPCSGPGPSGCACPRGASRGRSWRTCWRPRCGTPRSPRSGS